MLSKVSKLTKTSVFTTEIKKTMFLCGLTSWSEYWLYCYGLTLSFSGLQTFTHRMWSNSQSMGLSLWNIRKNSAISGRSRVLNIFPGKQICCQKTFLKQEQCSVALLLLWIDTYEPKLGELQVEPLSWGSLGHKCLHVGVVTTLCNNIIF